MRNQKLQKPPGLILYEKYGPLAYQYSKAFQIELDFKKILRIFFAVLQSGADTPRIILIWIIITREHWMFYKGPGFLTILLFVHAPLLHPLTSAKCLSFSVSVCVAGRAYLRKEVGSGRGAKSYDHEKAWPSINHSILSDYKYCIVYAHNHNSVVSAE